jgi:hypothetical protein
MLRRQDCLEYLLKWRGVSYMHTEWVTASLMREYRQWGVGRMNRMVQSVEGQEMLDDEEQRVLKSLPLRDNSEYFDPNFVEVDRIIATREELVEAAEPGAGLAPMEPRAPVADADAADAAHANGVVVKEEGGSGAAAATTAAATANGVVVKEEAAPTPAATPVPNGDSGGAVKPDPAAPAGQAAGRAKGVATDVGQSIGMANGGRAPPSLFRSTPSSIMGSALRRMYLVKWQGLPYSQATWEWEEDVGDDRTIARFQRFQHPPALPAAPPSVIDQRPSQETWKRYAESPQYLGGRELRPYQLEGLNWLVFSWYQVRFVLSSVTHHPSLRSSFLHGSMV